MFQGDYYLASPLPFWFASSKLLADLFRAELTVVSRLLSENLELPNLFDAPEATPAQRTTCFALLAHRKLALMIDETLVGRYEQSPSLGDVESSAFYRALNLVPPDAPAWVLDMDKVVELLPQRMLELLPGPLRRQGFDREDDSAQLEAMQSFSTVEQIQTFTEGVLDQQLRRLGGRWSTTTSDISLSRPDRSPVKINSEILNGQTPQPKKEKARRTQDRKRVHRDRMIAEIDEVAETPAQFLKMMDERNVMPQPTWSDWPGSWVQAYRNPRLRELIHKDKSRSISRARIRRNT